MNGHAAAQTRTYVVNKGGAQAPPLALPQDQALMLKAAAKMSERKHKEAEILYTQAIGANGNNINAYLQRGLARRDLGDLAGMESDARRALGLINSRLLKETNNADLYYQRSLAERLLKQFDSAAQDLKTAMGLKPSSAWANDLKALELERRMVQ